MIILEEGSWASYNFNMSSDYKLLCLYSSFVVIGSLILELSLSEFGENRLHNIDNTNKIPYQARKVCLNHTEWYVIGLQGLLPRKTMIYKWHNIFKQGTVTWWWSKAIDEVTTSRLIAILENLVLEHLRRMVWKIYSSRMQY